MSNRSNSRPVLILGASPRISVPIARSLHQFGIPVEVASFQSEDPHLRSRAIRRFHRLPARAKHRDEFAASLLSLIRERRFDMLVPVSDPALAVVMDRYHQLSPLLRLGCPAPQIVQSVLDKSSTLAVAQQCGIKIPFTRAINTLDELNIIAPELRFPVVAKPRRKGAAGFRINYFHNLAELSDAWASHDWGPVLLQEYCPGIGVGIEMLICRGECVAAFQHRRLKESPSTGGVAVLAVAEAPDPTLHEASLALLRALNWEGVAMVEFRGDPQTGNAVLMEVNGRYWGSSSFPILAGVNFPFYQWQLAHGEKPEVPSQYAVGSRWRWTAGYVERFHQVLAGTAADVGPKPGRTQAFADLLRDFSPGVRDALWSWSDPLPAIAEFSRTLLQSVRADFKWVCRRLLPKRLLKACDGYRNLGPAAGPIYVRLRALDALGMRASNKPRVSPLARSFLFVCHGNIMRSPMAEALMKRALPEIGHEGPSVSSAGMHATPGKEAHPWAELAARQMGISLQQHRARLVTPEMVQQADAIFAMDFRNKAELLALYPQAANKVFMLSAYAAPPWRYREIPDPYFGNEQVTLRCYAVLAECIRNLVSTVPASAQEKTNAHNVVSV